MASRVGVLGAGTWGTALAIHLARIGHQVRLWGREPEVLQAMAAERQNAVYLPGVPFPEGLGPASLDDACTDRDLLVFVCPSEGIRALAESVRPRLRDRPLLVTAAKGVEQDTRLTMSAILEEVLGRDHAGRVAALSGPSFAREVAIDMPTAVTAAARDPGVAEAVQRIFNGAHFRVYTSTDVIGV